MYHKGSAIGIGDGFLQVGLVSFKFQLGNLDAKRDWGYAEEYVKAMWLMLQLDQPDDYVIATGESHSVREFAELAFSHVGLDYKNHVEVDPELFRPAEVHTLTGDASRAKNLLKWQYHCSFRDLVKKMVDADIKYYSDIVKQPII